MNDRKKIEVEICTLQGNLTEWSLRNDFNPLWKTYWRGKLGFDFFHLSNSGTDLSVLAATWVVVWQQLSITIDWSVPAIVATGYDTTPACLLPACKVQFQSFLTLLGTFSIFCSTQGGISMSHGITVLIGIRVPIIENQQDLEIRRLKEHWLVTRQ